MRTLSGALLLLVSTDFRPAAAKAGRPKLHAITYSDSFDLRLSLPLSTAQHHGFHVAVLGFGHKTGWGPKASTHFNIYREYIFNSTEPDDIILMFDAYDVAFVGGEAEIIDLYLAAEARTGRELIYNAETWCSSPRKSEYPHFDSPWRYLNCGILIGRSRAARKVFEDRIAEPLVDAQGKPLRLQNWHTNWYLEHQDVAMIDTGCELTQVVLNIPNLYETAAHPEVMEQPGAKALVWEEGRIRNTMTNSTPPILHFPGHGHWPDYRHPERPGTCIAYEVLRSVAYPAFAQLTEAEWDKGTVLSKAPWKSVCTNTRSVFDQIAIMISHVGDSVIRWWFVVISWPGILFMAALAAAVARPLYWRGRKLFRDKFRSSLPAGRMH